MCEFPVIKVREVHGDKADDGWDFMSGDEEETWYLHLGPAIFQHLDVFSHIAFSVPR